MAAQLSKETPEVFPPDIRTPGERALYRVIINLSTGFASFATRTDQQIADLRTDLGNFIGGVRLELEGRKLPSKRPPPIPPTRAESPSYLDLIETVRQEARAELQKKARETTGPLVQAKPEELEDLVEKLLVKALQSRQDNDDLKAYRDQKKLRRRLIVAFMLAAATAAGAAAWQRGAGKAEGIIEERTRPSAPAPTTR